MTLLAAARQRAPLRRDLQSVTHHCESPSPWSYLMTQLSQGCSTQANDFSWATELSSAGAYSRKVSTLIRFGSTCSSHNVRTGGGLDPHMQPHRCSLQANQCTKPTMKQGRLLPLPALERFRPDVRRAEMEIPFLFLIHSHANTKTWRDFKWMIVSNRCV